MAQLFQRELCNEAFAIILLGQLDFVESFTSEGTDSVSAGALATLQLWDVRRDEKV